MTLRLEVSANQHDVIGRVRLSIAVSLVVIATLAAVAGVSETRGQTASPEAVASADVPVLAYYYIWFDPQSWRRAKTDYPLLGRYSSDDPTVMRQHVKWAKRAGIEGFIVSWKNTDKLSARLATLVDIAQSENFKLVIIYQGLDFVRDPLSIDQIAADLDYFADRYGDNDVFDLFGKPVVIWSGTWEFSTEEIRTVADPRRDRLQILASEKQVEGYMRLAGMVDGNAYYWSSVNPDTQPDYGEKLGAMAAAVHQNSGIWIAPAAPGFDARLIGGSRVVARDDGDTLRQQMSVALTSSPDAIGVISWNEFSENSHIEPSCEHDGLYLAVIADVLGGASPASVGLCPEASPVATPAEPVLTNGASGSVNPDQGQFDFDSSGPGGAEGLGILRAILLTALAAGVGMSVAIIIRRSRNQAQLIKT